ncbi:unnamed protein product [Adineta ricciae]|uniref:Protein kinase domain-containing protein n=1 Tax=Adineta ricciae TaxID=249248 RepID=A0A814Y0M1_ADIRI|nr:unnamed protein product [Adineta ricciae]CAF1222828.1 unnamed protein product [Adineta ricciae]
MWPSRFKQYSVVEQQQDTDHHENDTNLAFTIPREFITRQDLTSGSLFHGGIDSPSINAIDPVLKQPVHITKYLCLKSKTSTQQYINHLYERILLTSHLSHPNVRRILSWYIADACLYSITALIQGTLRHAIQSETFSLERIARLSSQIINGTIYLQSKGLCPLTPWYTTNIELTRDDRILLCSPTISTTKLNGGIVHHHHLWRHAPESLIRMIIESESHVNIGSFDNSKEDVWSIACIMVEMMINTILFRPPNDGPALQLLCIVQFVGGLTTSLIDCFPAHVKQLFSNIRCDSHQQRLNRLLRQIFHQYANHVNDYSRKDHLYDLLKQMFQFQSDKRLDLQSLITHPFYAFCSSNMCLNKPRLNILKVQIPSIRIDDLVHLCTKLHLEQSRWILTLKERCLLELILHIDNFNQLNFSQLGLSQPLLNELQRLVYFLTGNQSINV